jgi:Protein required for attachment to host cells
MARALHEPLPRYMNTTPEFVMTVDAARARIFKIDGKSPRGLATLNEVASVVNPEARIQEAQRHSDSSPTGSMGANGSYQTYDDHRANHAQEERKRFAKLIASTLSPLATTPSNAVVCVTHSMQALLNDAMSRHCPQVTPTLRTIECTLLKPHDLTAMLTDKGLLQRAATA